MEPDVSLEPTVSATALPRTKLGHVAQRKQDYNADMAAWKTSQPGRHVTSWERRSRVTREILRRGPAQTGHFKRLFQSCIISSDSSDRISELWCRNHGLRMGKESHGTYQGLDGPRCQSADFPEKEMPGQVGVARPKWARRE